MQHADDPAGEGQPFGHDSDDLGQGRLRERKMLDDWWSAKNERPFECLLTDQ